MIGLMVNMLWDAMGTFKGKEALLDDSRGRKMQWKRFYQTLKSQEIPLPDFQCLKIIQPY
jgi:hypothetical protein